MKTTQQQQAIRNDFEKDDEYKNNCYLLSPAIGKRKTIGGKSYFVRGYFKGRRDFETSMKRIATDCAYKKAR